MEFDRYEHGVPCWADASCPDIDTAAAFYSELFGWEIPPGDPQFGGYRTGALRGRLVAGLMGQDQPGPAYWGVYINADDAADIAERVTANGGSVVVPATDVGELGKMVIFTDPQGATLGAWQPGLHVGAGICNEPGTMCWNDLMTTDVEAAKRFYSAVFGWTWAGSDDYAEFQVGGRAVGGVMPMPPGAPEGMPPAWSVYFAVDDVDAALARIADLGGSTIMPNTPIEGVGSFAVATDPNGAFFDVIALTSAAA